MLQVRKLVLAVAAATAFSSSFTHALGLGDLSVKSSLNQPLEAEISLLEVRDLTSIEIKSQLASPEEFSKAGVDRQFFLTGLKFTPVIDANGKSVIRVTSSKPVKEPYLNFLVEVLWPNGRLLREYTLLLDPPLYAPQQVIYAPQPAATSTLNRAQPTPPQARQPQPIARTAAHSAPVRAANTALQGSEYRVQRNDTLWEIAQRVGGNASIHQTMLAIQDLNPNAFLDGNINRMKSGQVLRLPSAQEINSRSRAEAIAQVSQQNSSWKTGRAAPALAERQLDATHRSEAGAAPAQVEQGDSLKLVADAPGQAQQAADQGSAANARALQDQLALSKERLDSTLLENEELQSRVADLNSQLEKLQRLIELKDNQLAQLQNAVDGPLVEPAESSEGAAVDSETLADSADTTETLEPAAETVEAVEAPVVAQDTVEPDQAAVAETVEVAAEPEPEPAPVPAVEPEEAIAPAAVEPQAEEKNIIDTVMDDPMLLAAAGGGAILALLLALLAVSRSRARKEAELYSEQLDETLTPDTEADVELPSFAETAAAVAAAPAAAANKETDTLAESFDFDQPVVETAFKEEKANPLAEAESYISFGRFNQAADVLNTAIESEPERLDLRLKLAEALAELDDHVGFSRQLNEITEMGGAATELAQIKARYPHMLGVEQVDSVTLDDDFADLSLDDLTLDTPAGLTTPAIAELDAELDDLSALLAEQEDAPAESVAAAEPELTDKPATDFDFDFDLDLDLSSAEVAPTAADPLPAPTSFADEDKEDLDLNIDDLNFDLEIPAEPKQAQVDGLDELSFDDLDFAESSSAQTTDFALPDDFDFALPSADDEKPAEADFNLQLDEVSAELDTLSASLAAEAPDAFDGSAADIQSTEEPVQLDAALQEDGIKDLDGIDDDFSFLSGTDETATKLDLARAYIDMGDAEGARDILDEVIAEGNPAQQDEARELISQLG